MSSAQVLARPLTSLPAKDAGGAFLDVAVDIVPMTRSLTALWHRYVQPLVDGNYVQARSASPLARVRADVGWDWRTLHLLARLHTVTSRVGRSGPALAMCIVVHPAHGSMFPIGMLTMVPRLHCAAFGSVRSRGFAWFLADAPQEAYQTVLKSHHVKGVAAALVDCSIQATLDATADGTHLLHADPNGGRKLVEFYRDRLGMDQLPAHQGPVTPIFRRSASDQYFHFSDAQATRYSRRYDARR